MSENEKPVILVVGAGTMGASIAQVFAAAGYKTYACNRTQSTIDAARGRINTAIEGLITEGIVDDSYAQAVDDNLYQIFYKDVPDIAGEADVVFESVTEDPAIKTAVYRMLSDHCKPSCILASNTSGMDIFGVCDGVVFDQTRQIIAHWFNPPHLMNLVEVVRGPETSDETTQAMRQLLEAVGKKPAVLNKFVPGFIVNRIATVINRELYYMVGQGWISGEDAENAIRWTHGMRFGFEGPLALWDFVGLKIPMAVAKGGVLESLCNDTDCIPLGDKLVEEGKTGVAAGEGVLKYDDPAAYAEKRNRRIIQMAKIMQEWDAEDSQA